MYITDSNQYAIELVTYLMVLVVYFYEFIVYMLLERNAFDSIAFFSQYIFMNIQDITDLSHFPKFQGDFSFSMEMYLQNSNC